MNYGDIKYFDVSDGEGIRVSIFVSGCNHHCSHCFNQKTWDPTYGKEFTTETEQEIMEYVKEFADVVTGISLLGGDPTYPANISPLADFVDRFKLAFPNKDVWVWSGYTLEKIKQDPQLLYLIEKCDVLVDGKFIEELKDLNLKFRGSSNQRVIDIKESLKLGVCILKYK